MGRSSRQPVSGPGASGWERFGVVLIDNLLVLAAFLPGFLTGIASGAGATGWPDWASPALCIVGVTMGVGVLVWNGGVLAGRGRSLGMSCCHVSLVDDSGYYPVGTSRALTRSLLCLVFNRINGEPSFAERQTRTVLVSGHLDDLRPSRQPGPSSVPSMYQD